jgi:hypothetical protein
MVISIDLRRRLPRRASNKPRAQPNAHLRASGPRFDKAG